MPGSRLHSFRQGDLAEGLGIQMLRRFAAVAPVPREEDFGIDAVCTALRREGRNLVAENTFAVQIKSESETRIEMNETACRWLRNLDIPLFLLKVDLKSACAALYSYEWAIISEADLSVEAGTRTLVTEVPANRKLVADLPHLLLDESGEQVERKWRWLGPPIISFALHQLAEDDRVDYIRKLIKQWGVQVAECISLRKHDIHHQLKWETGKPPRKTSLIVQSLPEDAAMVFTALFPLICKAEIALHTAWTGELKEAFEAIKKKAAELGVTMAR